MDELPKAGTERTSMSTIRPRFLFFSTLLLVTLGLVACSKPYRPAVFEPPNRDFSGIDPTLSASGAASLIMIHGMCHHTPAWFQGSLVRLSDRLGADRAGSWSFLMSDPETRVMALKANVVRGDERLRVYGILYAETTRPLKVAHLCRDVREENAVCESDQAEYSHTRASVNNAVKNSLLNDCLADAVIYLGPTGEKIRDGVGRALEAVYRDMEGDTALATGPVMYLSESLGSKVLGDALVCSTPAIAGRIYPQLARTSHLFLGANQIPLLNLGHRGPGCPAVLARRDRTPLGLRLRDGGVHGLAELIKRAQSVRSEYVAEPAIVVAFTDPNDLLSYTVASDDFGGLPVVNVIVSNDWTWFGAFENPTTAHAGYRANDDVTDILRCGRQGVEGGQCKGP